MAEEDLRAERLKKFELLKTSGMDPYPARVARTSSIGEFLKSFDERLASSEQESLAGRIMSIRGHGGILFADLFDGTGRVQIVLKQNEVKGFQLFVEAVDQGDFISATGTALTTKRGEQSLSVAHWTMAAKSLMPIPDEWFGIKDEETRLRQRYLDILLDSELHAMFERRAKFWQCVRQFLLERGFLEVETPVLETSPGGADARPFVTHHNALDIDVYLRISVGELWQKTLLVAGFPKVFEIGRIFRNEGESREHLQDFTNCEFYEAYSDLEQGGEMVKELYRRIAREVYGKTSFEIDGKSVDFEKKWEVIDFCSAIEKEFGLDPLDCSEEEAIEVAKQEGVVFGETPNKARAVDHLWKKIRKTIVGPAFLVGVPVYLEPLAKRYAKNPRTVERLQVILVGSEVGKGFSELNDPLDQRKRFEEQQRLRDEGDDEAQRLDEEYVRAMEYGMPPAFGFAVPLRLFSILENKPIHEIQLFPLLRPKE
ncbi:MAG: lysine--tRNA ligase [Minisyncoccia bacterium]